MHRHQSRSRCFRVRDSELTSQLTEAPARRFADIFHISYASSHAVELSTMPLVQCFIHNLLVMRVTCRVMLFKDNETAA